MLDSEKTNYKKATFAGGCFWCMVKPFDQWPGVISVVSGYTGGHVENPTYKQVCEGTTCHREAVQITFDPSILSYETILDVFWHQIDPTDEDGQFCDRGSMYRTAVYYHDEEQKRLAVLSIDQLTKSGRFNKPIVTPILPAMPFYSAEDYHQEFYKKDPNHYHAYRAESGRDAFIVNIWGDDATKNESH